MRELLRRCGMAVVPAVLLVLAPSVPAGPLALAPGDRAPLLAGRNLSGDLVGIEFNRVTLVNFWATWCEPCIREMPALEGLHRNWSEEGLQVVGVVKEQIEHADLVEFVDRLGVTYPILTSRRRTSGDWGGVATLPVTFLIDGEQIVLRRYVGASPEQIDAMVYDVEAAMKGQPLGPMVVPDKPEVARPDDRPKPGAS